jgi:hypothetical protein
MLAGFQPVFWGSLAPIGAEYWYVLLSGGGCPRTLLQNKEFGAATKTDSPAGSIKTLMIL